MEEKGLYPLGDKVLLKVSTETTTCGGVILPDLAQENTMTADVISVGPGQIKDNGERIPMSCKVGDQVVFPKFAAHKFEYQDEEYIVIRETDILTRIGQATPQAKELLHD